jgi:peptidyl-prolyl cis-trans isomerase SurA
VSYPSGIKVLFLAVFIFLGTGIISANESILVQIGHQMFDINDFERICQRDETLKKKDLDECLEKYIQYQLKIIAAKAAGIDTLSSFICEWTKYSDQYAIKFQMDKIVNEQLLREAYERSLYEVKAAHILIKVDGDDTIPAYRRIMQIRDKIISGENFEEMARIYSDDTSAKMNHGDLGYFSVFHLEYPVETAAYLALDGSISLPVRSSQGYHLIKVYDHRAVESPPSFEESLPDLRRKISNNDRLYLAKDKYIAYLKKKYSFSENTSLLSETEYTNSLNRPLFSFAGIIVPLSDFVQYLSVNKDHKSIEILYHQFVCRSLLDYERTRFPEDDTFRNVINTYHDGLLLIYITENEVRKKAQDSVGLLEFYQKNKRKFRWKKRMVATAYFCNSEEVAMRASRLVGRTNEGKGSLPNNLFIYFCETDGGAPCLDTVRMTLPKGTNSIFDQINWKKGVSKILEWDSKFVFLDIHTIYPPSRKTFVETRGEVLSEYGKELENQWIKRLKKEYPVTVNKEMWADIKKKSKIRD